MPHGCEGLPERWRQRPYREDVRRIGDDWAKSRASLALRVPSVLSPSEHNLLVNPDHPDFARLALQSQQAWAIDPRLRY